MKHFTARTCGYNEGKCVGIDLSTLSLSLSLADIFSCGDSTYNFYCLPRKFTGITVAVDYIDLSGVKSSFNNCTTSYLPFLLNGLFDAFKYLQNYISDSLQCYALITEPTTINWLSLPIGILLPVPPPTEFQPITGLSVPTGAAAIDVSKIRSLANLTILSGCTLFAIFAKRKTRKTFTLGVSIGKVVIKPPESDRIVLDVQGIPYTSKRGQYSKSEYLALLNAVIYLVIQQDVLRDTPTFVGKVLYVSSKYTNKHAITYLKLLEYQTSLLTWVFQLGHISMYNNSMRIIQALCGPIEIPAGEIKPYKTDAVLTYVKSWDVGSTRSKWLPVKDYG